MTELKKDTGKPSLMGKLADRRAELEKKLFLTLRVPRWEDPIIRVTYRPIEVDEIENAFEKLPEAVNKAEARLDAEAALLAIAVTEITTTYDSADEPEERWSNFGPDFAAALGGVEAPVTAVKIVRRMFLTEPDILSHSGELAEWSGSANKQLREKFSGE